MVDKILIVNPGPVYPVKAMSQMRTHNMIRTLSKDFRVDLLTPYTNDKNLVASKNAMGVTGGLFVPIKSAKHNRNIFRKRVAQAIEYLNYYGFGIDKEVTCYRRNNRKISEIIAAGGYKVVISNYWEGSLYFKDLGSDVFKILDPHYAVGENFDVLEKKKSHRLGIYLERKRLENNLRMEREIIKASSLLLPLSERNQKEFEKAAPHKPMLLVADGADLDYFFNFSSAPEPGTLLFYGAIGSNQNRHAFNRLYNNILPELRKCFPGIKLLVVGSNPPDEIKALHNGSDIIVTGFVEDIRPWLAKSWLSIIPLELGSGFRGRVIELMAMGVPVVGTHNALDSIGIENGKQGFIEDTDEGMVRYSVMLLNDAGKRNEIAQNACSFAKEKYSLQATFGKLNEYLKYNF